MKTVITSSNPYDYNRHGFAWEKVPVGGKAHLDYGCFEGDFLDSLKGKQIPELVGVDVAEGAVNRGLEKFGKLQLLHIKTGEKLVFDDKYFSSITCLDVIEHAHDQKAILRELYRVLTDDGVLIVTVPRRHIFSFLDKGNFKFLFPRLHKWYYCRKHSPCEYQKRYVDNPNGLVGDISSEKGWHEHFSDRKLAELLGECGFEMIEFDGSGLFFRVISMMNFLFSRLEFLKRIRKSFADFDARVFKSTNLFCVAKKAGT